MKFPKQVFGFTSAKLRYLPVKQDEAFMSNEHASMPVNPQKALRKEHLKASWKVLLILCLLSTNFITFFYLIHSRGEETPPEYARVQDIKTTWTRFWWWTEYSGKNKTATDELWDSILPSHGFIAMDRRWAADHHWPESLMLPSDLSKGVYLLEAYHQIHCLRMIRKTFWEAVNGRNYTYKPSPHLEHCFDTLRQTIICHADNTPLYSFGDSTAGNGQLHKCRNWDDLRNFATEHTACYRDTIEDVPLKEHFGFCDDGTDSLRWVDESGY